MVSVLSGPVYDLGYYRTLVLSGTFLNVLGIMMLSLSSQYYELFLSHVCNGVGSGLLYVPTLAFVVQGHGRTRSLAMGIVAAGIALGVFCYGEWDRLTSTMTNRIPQEVLYTRSSFSAYSPL